MHTIVVLFLVNYNRFVIVTKDKALLMMDKQENVVVVQEYKQLPDIEVSEITIKNLIYVITGTAGNA